MEAGVTRASVIAIVACLAAVACDEDPACSVKVASRPPGTAVSVVGPPGTVATARNAEWRPESCPPPPEDSPGRSALVVTGPCAFEHRGAVSCESTRDDFIIAATRKAAHGATLVIYVNVEKYAGPGSYNGAQMFVEVEDGTSIYRWSNDNFPITVGRGEEFAVLPATRLDAEPLLVNCSGQVGPQSNWLYDCKGVGGSTPIEGTTEVVSGTLWCDQKKKE
jgi:hypothetical protein